MVFRLKQNCTAPNPHTTDKTPTVFNFYRAFYNETMTGAMYNIYVVSCMRVCMKSVNVTCAHLPVTVIALDIFSQSLKSRVQLESLLLISHFTLGNYTLYLAILCKIAMAVLSFELYKIVS